MTNDEFSQSLVTSAATAKGASQRAAQHPISADGLQQFAEDASALGRWQASHCKASFTCCGMVRGICATAPARSWQPNENMKTLSSMNSQTGGYLFIFGIFAILLGAIGYQTHQEDAVMALMFRGGFGVLLVLCGILGAKHVKLSWLAGLFTVTLLGLGGVWRVSSGWLAVAHGQSENVFAALVSTLMLALAGVLVWLLIKDRKIGDARHSPMGHSE